VKALPIRRLCVHAVVLHAQARTGAAAFDLLTEYSPFELDRFEHAGQITGHRAIAHATIVER
jgi:hypothetical protein